MEPSDVLKIDGSDVLKIDGFGEGRLTFDKFQNSLCVADSKYEELIYAVKQPLIMNMM